MGILQTGLGPPRLKDKLNKHHLVLSGYFLKIMRNNDWDQGLNRYHNKKSLISCFMPFLLTCDLILSLRLAGILSTLFTFWNVLLQV